MIDATYERAKRALELSGQKVILGEEYQRLLRVEKELIEQEKSNLFLAVPTGNEWRTALSDCLAWNENEWLDLVPGKMRKASAFLSALEKRVCDLESKQ